MKKKLKSLTDINKEIDQIFENYNNLNELTNKINNYILNITGKELVSKFHIYSRIVIKAKMHFRKNPYLYRKFTKNVPIIFIENNVPEVIKDFKYISTNQNIELQIFMSDIISHSKEFDVSTKEYKNYENIFDMDLKVIKENKKLSKLYAFLEKNTDITKLLYNFLIEYENEILLNLILEKKLNKDYLIYFIDKKLDLKQNVEYLYDKLEKKLPKQKLHRISIQQALQKGLKTKGKFISPNIKVNKKI
ncbi:MAG: hypothetical protein M3R36_05315 [Bacteroidota bacterium]|nr:hypothetical protein [Bacteroidota bacterium]